MQSKPSDPNWQSNWENLLFVFDIFTGRRGGGGVGAWGDASCLYYIN